jgi:hypothetical protein
MRMEKLHIEEVHISYVSPNIIRVIKSRSMGGACGTNGRDGKCIHNLVTKPEGMWLLERPGRRREDRGVQYLI